MRTRAAILTEFGAPLAVRDIEVAEPGEGDVRVRILASGICGSDAKVQSGRNPLYPSPPVVLGHESAGVVDAVGRGVTTVVPGDHVLVAMNRACGRCADCARGRAHLCTDPARRAAISGRLADGRPPFVLDGREVPGFIGIGSFAGHVVVGEQMLVPVPAEDFHDALALLTCAVVTGAGAVWNVARVRPGDSVLVVGCGGVGLNVVQAAALAGAGQVIAADVVAGKLELAQRLGATAVLPADEGLADRVHALEPAGVCHAFDATGADGVAARAMAATRPGATTVLVGSPAVATVAVPAGLLAAGRVLRGCVGGNAAPAADLPRLVELVRTRRFQLEPLVTERVVLDDVNTALDRLRAGQVARSLIVFD